MTTSMLMKNKCFCVTLLFMFLMQVFVSCSEQEYITGALSENNKFLTTIANSYDVSLTRSGSLEVCNINDGNITGNVVESDWSAVQVEKTRAFTVGNNIFWKDNPNLALFLKDASGNVVVKDLPLSPASHYLYSYYYNPSDYGADANNNAGKQKVDGSEFFWDNFNIDAQSSIIDFYGYYPRPYNRQDDNVKYTSASIINETDARSGSSILKYKFTTEQKDDNLDYFDLMVAAPESVSKDTYGCKGKKRGDNVQMRFKHLFSCLMITINRGTYQGNCIISSLKISGTQVKTSGTLDIEKGTIQQGMDSEPITRNIPVGAITKDSPLETEMILQPTTDDEIADAGKDTERLRVTCVIDGAEYSCSLAGLKLKGGKKYHINLTLTPTDIVTFQVWDGANVTLGGVEHDNGTFQLTQKDIESFEVKAKSPDFDVYVCKDGDIYNPEEKDGSIYKLTIDKGKNTIYNIVTYPKNESWYIVDARAIHFDAKWRDKFYKDASSQTIKTWSDLSGHNNDGTLIEFDPSNESSGWTSNGLRFDGVNDLVTFPGHINSKSFTIEMYVNISSAQYSDSETKPYKRLFGEPENNKSGFLALYIGDGAYRFGLFGLGNDTYFGKNGQIVFDEVVQYDFVFENGTLKAYKNGVEGGELQDLQDAQEQTLASIGGRIKDNSRNLCAVYHSFILYDKALNGEEIQHNYEVNKTRYGVTRK